MHVFVVEQGFIYLIWLMFVALAYLYNFISIPLRIAFPLWNKERGNIWTWMVIDYASDLLYIIDICLVRTRIKYLENGLWVVSYSLNIADRI
jgi:cyclic nucleotide gated channel beta 1